MSGALKEIRTRIQSVQSTQKITKAMKVVSAAKLRKAQDAILRIRPYAEKLTGVLKDLSSSLESNESVYSEEREVKELLIVPITSNRGLCGAFNSGINKECKRIIELHKGSVATVLPIGKKAFDFFKRTEYIIKGTALPRHLHTLYDNLDFEHITPVAESFIKTFRDREFDRILLVYNRFKNAAVQIITTEQFLPILPPEPKEDAKKIAADYIFEPEKERILQELIPKSLKTQLFKAILDSYAAEHGARMTAMDKATENANELLGELRLNYNSARQAAITTELTEIVGGAEALRS